MSDQLHDWQVLDAYEAQRQHPGTLTVRIGCADCRQAFVSTLMEPCPYPEDEALTTLRLTADAGPLVRSIQDLVAFFRRGRHEGPPEIIREVQSVQEEFDAALRRWGWLDRKDIAMSERQRARWDNFYRDLARLQDRTLELAGDDLGADLYELLGDCLVEAELIAPPGWSPTDIGLPPPDPRRPERRDGTRPRNENYAEHSDQEKQP